jgi:hypothetical protein
MTFAKIGLSRKPCPGSPCPGSGAPGRAVLRAHALYPAPLERMNDA